MEYNYNNTMTISTSGPKNEMNARWALQNTLEGNAAWGQQQSHSVPLLADDSKRGAKKSAQRGSLSCFWTRDGG